MWFREVNKFMNIWKWLYPGIGFKRWLLLALIGVILCSSGIAILTRFHFVSYIENIMFRFIFFLTGHISNKLNIIFASIIIIVGIIIIVLSLKKVAGRVTREFSPNNEIVDVLYEKKVLEKGPNIVALGGGTGLSNLLRGIKNYTSNITAIVTVTDDGGSSGKLRDELNILPPGDIRNCLVALADTEPLMERLFQYRFSDEGHLVGHSFGNLFIASMTQVLGDFEGAIKESSKVLAIKGQVLPATNEDVRLGAIYVDESTKMGESVIPTVNKKIDKVFLDPACCMSRDSLEAIKRAEIITVGPGSLYTSILPNLLVDGMVDVIRESQALKIYICNVMTQPGETTGYTVSDHIQTIIDHVGENLFDYVIVNKEEGATNLAKKYEEEGAFPVKVDKNKLNEKDMEIIEENLLTHDGYIRHDPDRLAELILKIDRSR